MSWKTLESPGSNQRHLADRKICALSTQPNPQPYPTKQMAHWWILGSCLSNQRRKPHDTEDVDNGHLKECREFDVDLHCNTFKIRFRAVYTQAYGGDRTRKTHGCQTRTPSTFFFGPRKGGVRPHPPNPLGYVPAFVRGSGSSVYFFFCWEIKGHVVMNLWKDPQTSFALIICMMVLATNRRFAPTLIFPGYYEREACWRLRPKLWRNGVHQLREKRISAWG